MTQNLWPSLPYEAWKDTYATLHLYTQVVGKLRLALCPQTNQWWNVPFYVTARGLVTSPMQQGEKTFEAEFDWVGHNLYLRSSLGEVRALALIPRTVHNFYYEVQGMLHSMGFEIPIRTMPAEIPNAIRFEKDMTHRSYDAEQVERFWKILSQVDQVFKEFRSHFRGKCSPVQFYWGSFDLAVTRFNGRKAPARPGADSITRVAYDEEVISLGFWPGDSNLGGPAFYSYTAPEPSELWNEKVSPEKAYYLREKKEFFLLYEEVRRAKNPAQTILQFAQSTYEAGAKCAKWDRGSLEYGDLNWQALRRTA